MDLRYWARAGRSLVRNTRTPRFLADVARSGLRADTQPKAPTRAFLDAYPDAEGMAINLGVVEYRRSNLDPMEQFALAAIARLRQPRTIFELGTYDGATTLLLARTAPHARILTLDLDPTLASAATVADEVENARTGVGSRYAGRPEADRIEQLFGDSRRFDFSPWLGTVDLVLVDAGHEYDSVAVDTATAFRLLRCVWSYGTTTWSAGRESFGPWTSRSGTSSISPARTSPSTTSV
jgi:predicted O-methyltransferase YrrM